MKRSVFEVALVVFAEVGVLLHLQPLGCCCSSILRRVIITNKRLVAQAVPGSCGCCEPVREDELHHITSDLVAVRFRHIDPCKMLVSGLCMLASGIAIPCGIYRLVQYCRIAGQYVEVTMKRSLEKFSFDGEEGRRLVAAIFLSMNEAKRK
jgi:hypothetical protein